MSTHWTGVVTGSPVHTRCRYVYFLGAPVCWTNPRFLLRVEGLAIFDVLDLVAAAAVVQVVETEPVEAGVVEQVFALGGREFARGRRGVGGRVAVVTVEVALLGGVPDDDRVALVLLADLFAVGLVGGIVPQAVSLSIQIAEEFADRDYRSIPRERSVGDRVRPTMLRAPVSSRGNVRDRREHGHEQPLCALRPWERIRLLTRVHY